MNELVIDRDCFGDLVTSEFAKMRRDLVRKLVRMFVRIFVRQRGLVETVGFVLLKRKIRSKTDSFLIDRNLRAERSHHRSGRRKGNGKIYYTSFEQTSQD